VLMFVRPRRGLLKAAVLATATIGLATSAHAQLQNAPVDLEIFRPAMDSKGFITVNSSAVLGQWDFSFGLVTSYARRPLQLQGNQQFGMPAQTNSFSVDTLVRPSLQAAVGFTKLAHLGIELGIILPMGVVSGRSLPTDPGPGPTNLDDREWTYANQGIGDLQVHPKFRFLNATRRGLGFAIIPSVILGTGDTNSFLGEGKTIFQPTAVLDTELGYLGRFRAAVNAGMRIRPDASRFTNNAMSFPTNALPVFMTMPIVTNAGIEVKNEVIGGVGVSYGIVPQKFDVVAEVYGNYGLASYTIDPTGATTKMKPSAEAIGAIKLYLARNSFFEIGAGWKVSNGYGSAQPRAFIGFIFEPSIGDRDGDGYKDDVDQCPDDPEDFDDFEDEDGCPEPDNDKDRILDDADKCPNDPETRNGYQDEDGCPDNTTFDRDGDHIPDDVDKCPDDPEDFDNFEDEDGCPDPDNDKDGIKDVTDVCPNDPEDKDGFEDTDGCPDPDNDHDRILDAQDKCPNEPENYNKYQDDDGCPDKDMVKLRKGKIEILDKIYFETDKDEIKPVSFPLLDAVAAVINDNQQIQLIEIQGHADERGDDAHNLDLTERRAASVRRALNERNVLPSRLKSRGYGETVPICNQHNEDCWSKNRRVEFIILKRSDEAKLQGGEGQ
jgi:OOP family OmpA-OmpF porin